MTQVRETIDARTAHTLEALARRHADWLGDRTSYKPEEVPEDCRMDNGQRSALEQYRTLTDPPESLFVYVDRDRPERGHRTVHTWTGDVLGHVIASGGDWRDNFGGQRENITVVLVNGVKYHGTFYKSAGNYARLRKAKIQPKAA